MQPLKVLVVDDSRVSRMMSKAFIEHLRPGYQVLEADSGAQALDRLSAATADIAILDMNMPGMNGLDLAAELKARAPSLRMAMLTANVQDAIRSRAEQIGLHFFRKPINEATIAAVLDTLDPRAAA